jgi:hypothetical protein
VLPIYCSLLGKKNVKEANLLERKKVQKWSNLENSVEMALRYCNLNISLYELTNWHRKRLLTSLL